MLKVGDKLPQSTLYEYADDDSSGCPVGPHAFDVSSAVALKTIALFAVPGAFTPTCSESHLPGFVLHAGALKAAGADEVWCISVNDCHVMRAWGKASNTSGKVRMIADGSAQLTRSAGLVLDLTDRGMGVRSQRFSMIVVDGIVRALNLENPGEFRVSSAEILLEQLVKLAH